MPTRLVCRFRETHTRDKKWRFVRVTTLRDDLDRLARWAKVLAAKVESTGPVVEEILAGQRELPAGCPSKESLAAMELSGVAQAFEEVEAAYRDVRRRL